MGEDNERPTDPADAVMLTSEYDGSGDLWALGNLPGRDGFKNNTYSCVWGMKNAGYSFETDVYESANKDPLLARDGGRQDITYNTIESRYIAADISEGTPRSVWGNYRDPDSGGADERDYVRGTNHFMLNGEYSYCGGNSIYGSLRSISVLDNIICEGSGGYSGY